MHTQQYVETVQAKMDATGADAQEATTTDSTSRRSLPNCNGFPDAIHHDRAFRARSVRALSDHPFGRFPVRVTLPAVALMSHAPFAFPVSVFPVNVPCPCSTT